MKPNASLNAFYKAMRKQHASSKGGTIAAERRNIIQSPDLQLFIKSRTGQPLKAQDWRS